jgi:hypothetical protein
MGNHGKTAVSPDACSIAKTPPLAMVGIVPRLGRVGIKNTNLGEVLFVISNDPSGIKSLITE